MAPSRALLRCAPSTAQRRPSPPLVCALRSVRTQPISTTSSPIYRCAASSPLTLASIRSPNPPLRTPIRLYSQDSSSSSPVPTTPQSSTLEPPDYLNEAELAIFKKIRDQLSPVKLEVQDISGGCGSMYALSIESPQFKGLSVIKQHKLVNKVLADEIAGWHGVQLRTKAA